MRVRNRKDKTLPMKEGRIIKYSRCKYRGIVSSIIPHRPGTSKFVPMFKRNLWRQFAHRCIPAEYVRPSGV